MYKNILRQLRGTIRFAVILILLYSIEQIFATLLGFSNGRLMLETLGFSQKRVIVLTVGPFIHRGISHIAENLVYLLIFGGYVEWQVGRRKLYIYCATTGYVASWLLVFITGGVGAVGASSITYGLMSVSGVLGFLRLVDGISNLTSGANNIRFIGHTAPFVMGFGFTIQAILASITAPTGGTEAIHSIGAIIGIFISSIIYLMSQFPIDPDLDLDFM